MPPYVIRASAREDIRQIGVYLRSRNPAAADRLVNDLLNTIETISQSPGIGRLRPDLAAGLHYLPAGVYLIFYQMRNKMVEIIRIVDGRRDSRGLFQE